MGRKSSIHRLPARIKGYIEALLGAGTTTLDELIADLRAAFPQEAQAGQLPSRSALGRYGQKLERRLAAIRASTEAAKLIQAQAGDDKDARSEALTALVQTELFDAILALQEADDPNAAPEERVAMLSAAAKNIATLTRSSVNLKKFQADAEERGRLRLLAEQRAKLQALGSKGGVTDETMRAIRRVLGIDDGEDDAAAIA
jgi:hypothetical protein